VRSTLHVSLVLLMLAGSPSVIAGTLIRIGLFPFYSPQQLIAQKEPFRRHLALAIEGKVHMETAPSLDMFMNRVAKGEYDLVLLPSHLGRLIQQDFRWRPLCKYIPDMTVYLVTRKHGGIRSADSLKGKVIATHDRALLLSLVAAEWLRRQGIPEHDMSWLETGGLVNSVYSVITGEADAAVASSSTLALLPQAELDQLRVLGEAGTAPQPYIVASPVMKPALISLVRDAYRSYSEDGTPVFAEIPSTELKSLDRYAAEARRRLGGHSGRTAERNRRTKVH
jgi:phosphonate transport system substrate-binding protein